MAEVRVIELLQESNENGAHIWVDIHVGEQVLTVRAEALQSGFRVYLRADDSIGQEVFVNSE